MNIDFINDTLIVIVLYNCPLYKSTSFLSLRDAAIFRNFNNNIDLMVYDNSKENQYEHDKDHGNNLNISYFHDPNNPGVSKAYNFAGKTANKLSKKWLFILDQDTFLPPDILTCIQVGLNDFPNFPVYAPKLYNRDLLLSPCKYYLYKGSNLTNISSGIHKMKYKNVLNSGLLVDLNAFNAVGGYDESVQLYFSDFAFFDKLKKVYKTFIVLNCSIDHQLSSIDYSDLKFALKRFQLYCKGANEFSKKSAIKYVINMFNIGIRSMLMSYRFKNTEFIKLYAKTYLG